MEEAYTAVEVDAIVSVTVVTLLSVVTRVDVVVLPMFVAVVILI